MAKLCSVGLDVGTTTTQLIVSELNVENKSGAFSVPELSITDRKILYESPVHFTPLLDESHVDGHAIRKIVEKEYQKAGITRQSVDTGAIIITGETSRKENAGAVLEALSDLAGEFVVATAGPDLESVLAARGAGALDYSAETGKRVLHMDIGGGTSNLALIEDGKIIRTGCLNVGGRLIKLENGNVIYISPVLAGLTDLQVGSKPKSGQIEALARVLASALEMAAGLREKTALLKQLWTQ
jgi:ethanolamine utilization protein EutA